MILLKCSAKERSYKHCPKLPISQVNQLVEIARPFAQDMKLLKPSLTREFIQYSTFQGVFYLEMNCFHRLNSDYILYSMYVYHRFNLRNKLFPKTPTKGNAIGPVLQVQNEYPLNLSEKLSKSVLPDA